jgi:hypothetical protein
VYEYDRSAYTEKKTQNKALQNVEVPDDALIVELSDGRTLSVPLTWFRVFCTERQRNATNGD